MNYLLLIIGNIKERYGSIRIPVGALPRRNRKYLEVNRFIFEHSIIRML